MTENQTTRQQIAISAASEAALLDRTIPQTAVKVQRNIPFQVTGVVYVEAEGTRPAYIMLETSAGYRMGLRHFRSVFDEMDFHPQTIRELFDAIQKGLLKSETFVVVDIAMEQRSDYIHKDYSLKRVVPETKAVEKTNKVKSNKVKSNKAETNKAAAAAEPTAKAV